MNTAIGRESKGVNAAPTISAPTDRATAQFLVERPPDKIPATEKISKSLPFHVWVYLEPTLEMFYPCSRCKFIYRVTESSMKEWRQHSGINARDAFICECMGRFIE